MLQLDQAVLHTSSPVLTSSSSNTTSLAATLTPGTPTALDELKHNNGILSLNTLNLTSLSSSSSALLQQGPPSSTASESNSDSSLLSSLGMAPDDDDEDYQYDCELDDDDYGSEDRTRRAKEAAKILLAQCLLEDNPRYYSDSFSKTSRLGLAPITLLLNPETPCPTKIIPLPDSSSYSLDDCPSSEDEADANDVQEAQAASLFIRLL